MIRNNVNGYFAPPATGGLSLYGLTPRRVLDTRNTPGLQPLTGPIDVSMLNSLDGAITSNLAIVSTPTGLICSFASGPNRIILDISGYFVP